MQIYTAAQMREFDRQAIEDFGISGLVLMENAALRVVEFLEAKCPDLREKRVAIFCGKGNNGGDGLAIARLLENNAASVSVFLACEKSQLRGDALAQLRPLQKAGEGVCVSSSIEEIAPNQPLQHFGSFDILIDALLGTGFRGEITDSRFLAARNFIGMSEYAMRVAVDLPSGMEADSGRAPEASYFDYTVTFHAPKPGFLGGEGLDKSGEVWVGEIGTLFAQELDLTGAQTFGLREAKNCLPLFKRPKDAHKGTAGRIVIIGGSLGMSGAPALAAKSAFGAGVGLCLAALPEKIMAIFGAQILEATSRALPCDDEGFLLESAFSTLQKRWDGAHCVALGPGIGRTEGVKNLVRQIALECEVPLVIDADALHALPAIADRLKARKSPLVLTPHPGEAGVLLGVSAREINENRFESARQIAQKFGAWVVLKGARTVVASPDDDEISVNLSGHPGMATGGSGDVLTGTLAGILAQVAPREPLYFGDAVRFAVYLHGIAGEIAAKTHGIGLSALDLSQSISRAWGEIETRKPEIINGRLRRLE